VTVFYDEAHPELGRTLEIATGPGSGGRGGTGGTGGLSGITLGCEVVPHIRETASPPKRVAASPGPGGPSGEAGRPGPEPLFKKLPSIDIQRAFNEQR
jgi:hypothetical protein